MSSNALGSPFSGATLSDIELTECIRTGPPGSAETALEVLYRRHREPVLAYARGCTRDPHTAEDLTSEAFARVLSAVRTGAGPNGAWRPYLLAIVRNTAIAWTHTERRTLLSEDFETWVAEESPAISGEEEVLRREEGGIVLRAFRSLPERWQTALWHAEVEGESSERIAPLLGVSPQGASSLVSRAREGLRLAYLTEYAAGLQSSDECVHYTGMLAAIARRGPRRRGHRGLDRHLESCDRCRRAWLDLRALNNTLGVSLVAGVLLWSGGYGVKGAAATAAGGVASAGGAAATGGATVAKVGMVTGGLVLAIGGYALFPGDDGESPRRSSAPAVSESAPSSTPRAPEARPSKSPERKPTAAASSPRRTAAPPAWSPAATDRTQLPIAATGQCMDISGAEGAQPREASCDGSLSQQWELIVDRAAQEARIRNRETGMCLTNTGSTSDGAAVRQRRACTSDDETARWTYFKHGDGQVAFALKKDSGRLLGLNDWWKAGEGQVHSPVIGTTMNYYDTTSLRFTYKGSAFG